MKTTGIPNLFLEGNNLYTKTDIKESIYGERIVKREEGLFREFSPLRSKLASSIKLGFRPTISRNDHVLYLGASTGTTVSHLSDVVDEGKIYAVEFSPVSMIKLMELGRIKRNIMPLHLDANKPESFSPFIDRIDLIYQDVAQPNQIEIFLKNIKYYDCKRGILMFKTYSIRAETEIKREIKKIKESFERIDIKDIQRFHKGHYAIYASKI